MLNKLVEFVRSRPLPITGVLAGVSLVLLIALIAALAGDGGEPAPEAGTSTTAVTLTPLVPQFDGAETTTSTEPGTSSAPVDRNPLTGRPLSLPSEAQIIAVKVDNGPFGKPQIGLDQAEMIIEAPAEGGITRFTALFFDSRPALIGPVRSMRSWDADVLASFGPFFVTTGGQDSVYREFRGAGIEIADQSEPGIFQSIERPTPSHLMATMAAVSDLAVGGPPTLAPVSFSDEWNGAGSATQIAIPFSSTTSVEYRFEGDRYRRYENGEQFEVLPTHDGELVPLEVDTIVVQFVAQRSAGYTDSAGADVPTYDVIGFGRVLVFHEGQMIEGQWQRGAQEDPTVLADADGTALGLPTGVLMWTIVPRQLEVSY